MRNKENILDRTTYCPWPAGKAGSCPSESQAPAPGKALARVRLSVTRPSDAFRLACDRGSDRQGRSTYAVADRRKCNILPPRIHAATLPRGSDCGVTRPREVPIYRNAVIPLIILCLALLPSCSDLDHMHAESTSKQSPFFHRHAAHTDHQGKQPPPSTQNADTAEQQTDQPAATQGTVRIGDEQARNTTTDGTLTPVSSDRPTTAVDDDTDDTISTRRQTAAPDDAITAAVLNVKDMTIRAEDVTRRIHADLVQLAKAYPEEVYRRRAASKVSLEIRNMIYERLVYHEAAAELTDSQMQIVDHEVDKALADRIDLDAGGSRVRYEAILARIGATIEQKRNDLRITILTQHYMQQKLQPRVQVTREELWDYYMLHKDDYVEPLRADVDLIEIDAEKLLDPSDLTWSRATPSQQQAALDRAAMRAEQAYTRLVAGEPFDDLCREYTNTALVNRDCRFFDELPRGQLADQQLDETIFQLEPGQFAQPLRTGDKYVIVRVTHMYPRKVTTFAEAQGQIRPVLAQRAYEKVWVQHMARLAVQSNIPDPRSFIAACLDRLPSYESLRNDF